MGLGSPLHSPVRSTAMGGAPRARAASAAHQLFHRYREIARGVERRPAAFDRAGTSSRRRELFAGAETGARRLLPRPDSTEPRRGGAPWSGMSGWEVARRGRCSWESFVVPLKGYYEGDSAGPGSVGAPSGCASQGGIHDGALSGSASPGGFDEGSSGSGSPQFAGMYLGESSRSGSTFACASQEGLHDGPLSSSASPGGFDEGLPGSGSPQFAGMYLGESSRSGSTFAYASQGGLHDGPLSSSASPGGFDEGLPGSGSPQFAGMYIGESSRSGSTFASASQGGFYDGSSFSDSTGNNLLLHGQEGLIAEEAKGPNQSELMAQEAKEQSCWGNVPVDILYCIFQKLKEPRTHWTAAALCASWRWASFQVERPMVISISSKAPLDPLPFQPIPLRLLIAEPLRLRSGQMQKGDRFGFHAPSAFPTVEAGSRLIGSYQGIPLFVDIDGHLELPTVCGAEFTDLIASRYDLPSGFPHQHICMGTIAEDKVAIATDSSLLLSKGTVPGVWYRASLEDHKIRKVISLIIAGGAAYLMDLDRRIFKAEVHGYSGAVLINLQVNNLPVRNEWEKLWLVTWPIRGSVVCIRHTEVGDTYQWNAFDLIKERGAWAWVQKADLDGCAVFVNWCSGSIGFAISHPERWGLHGNRIYSSYKGFCCRINWVYQHRIMPRENIIWPCPVWMLAAPSELVVPETCEMKSEE